MGTEKNTTNKNNINGGKIDNGKTYNVKSGNGEIQIPESARLEFEPIAFEAFGKTTRINSYKLAKLIREMFQKKFHDVIGAYVGFDGRNFNTTLFFQNNTDEVPEGKIKNLVNYQTNEGVNKNSIWEQSQMLKRRSSGKTFELNDATKVLLSSLMYGGANANKPNNTKRWNECVFERRIPAPTSLYQFGAENIVIGVTNIDIKLVLHMLFGPTIVTSTKYDQDGSVYNTQSKEAYYEVRYGKGMPDGSIMINIEQFDRQKVEKLIREENPQMAINSGIQMF